MANSSNLERRIEFPDTLTNSVVINEGEARLQYNVGIAKINFSGTYVYTSEQWIECREIETHSRKKVVHMGGLRLGVRKEPAEKLTLKWGVNTGHNSICRDGNPFKARDTAGYKRAIMDQALAKGVVLTYELVDSIFAQIDEKVVKLYNEVVKLRE